MKMSKFFHAAGIMILTICIYAGYANAGADEGKKIFSGKKCGDCHQTEGPNTDKAFADKLKRKGPDLWFAGSKFKKDWLKEWLEKAEPIRLLAYNSIEDKNPGNHPKLAKKEADEVVEYLMTLISKDVQTGAVQEGAANMQGKLAFEKKTSCFACHKYKKLDKVIGGLTGPSLAEAGKRLNADWIYAYLKNPKAFIPVKRMPIYEGILNDGEMKNIAQHVSTFK